MTQIGGKNGGCEARRALALKNYFKKKCKI